MHLLLTEIIAARAGIEVDRLAIQRQNEEAIAARERMRLTRDLHDGVLQSLTAGALQLNLAEKALDQDRRSRLELVKQLLAKEQRRIREFVDDILPKPRAEKITVGRDLRRQLQETARFWNCTASLSVAPPDAKIPQPLALQLSLMLSEAVANAARHGGASNIDVVMEKVDGNLVIKVCDDGKGFANRPTTQDSQQEVVTPNIAVASLSERVQTLGGSLSISSRPKGAELAIRFPLP